MKTVLVTGGAGFIGSNFIIYMLDKYKDYKIINLDNLTYAGNLMNLQSICKNSHYEFIHGDICCDDTIDNIFKNNNVDYVVNFAAESHVDRSILDPKVFIKTNVLGTFNLLNVAKKYWLDRNCMKSSKFLQVSTDEVYGSLGKDGFFVETTPIDPHSPYSASKAGADLLVKAYFDTYQMPINITRCSNNYGPFQFPEKLIPLMIINALNKRPLPVYGDGLNIRDWLYVEDHLRAIDLVLHEAQAGEVYNIGGHNEKTNIEIVNIILDYLGKNIDSSVDKSLIKYVEDRKGHDRRYGIDPTKITTELGWRPTVMFEEGIIKTIKWYLDNPKWVESVISGEYNANLQCNNEVIYSY